MINRIYIHSKSPISIQLSSPFNFWKRFKISIKKLFYTSSWRLYSFSVIFVPPSQEISLNTLWFSSHTSPISISRSKHPKRCNAGSIKLWQLMVPHINWCSLFQTINQSQNLTNNKTFYFTIHFIPSRALLGTIISISSIKIIACVCFSTSSKTLRKLDSDSPVNLLIILGPLIF